VLVAVDAALLRQICWEKVVDTTLGKNAVDG